MDPFFTELLPILLKFPMKGPIRVESCRTEYEACIACGIPHETIVAGCRCWLENHVPPDISTYFPLAPHNFLMEKSFLAYQPREAPALRQVK